MLNEMSFTTHSAGETRRLGERLGALMHAGDVVFLTGDLGAGKTTFCKGVARGLGVREDVTSPTFTLIAEYEGRVPVAHMDLYRLTQESEQLGRHSEQHGPQGSGADASAQITGAGSQGTDAQPAGTVPQTAGAVLQTPDFVAIGVEDYLMGGHAVLIEWPGALAREVDDALHIEVRPMPIPRLEEREFRCKATGTRSWERLDEWVKEWLF